MSGAGPAGLATAIFAAQAGLRVTVLERRRLPLDKPCGEGLMPGGVALLYSMGVRLRASRPFEGIRYVEDEDVAEARFRSGTGLGIRRTELSRALAERARELGVEILERTRVRETRDDGSAVRVSSDRGELETRWMVAADGLASPLRRAAGLEARTRIAHPSRYGVRRHFRVRPWSPFVEVHWADGAEAYVTPVGDEEVGVAILWRRGQKSHREWLERFPALSRRLADARVTSSAMGAGPLRRKARAVTRGRLALVGDAAGYVDALTGEGVALGFRSAEALVRSLTGGSLARYERDYWRLSRRYRTMTELVLALTRCPGLRRRAIRALSRRPATFATLLQHFHHAGDVEGVAVDGIE